MEANSEPDLIDFADLLITKRQTMLYLQSIGLLLPFMECVCAERMRPVVSKKFGDGYCWRCPKKGCQKTRSIRQNSIFSGSKLSLRTLTYLFFCFATDVPMYVVERLLGKHVKKKAILEWFDVLRGYCSKDLIDRPIKFLGEDILLNARALVDEVNADVVDTHFGVELDESFLGKKPKYHRGTSRQTKLAFGIVSRNGTKCSFHLIPDQKKATLLPLIEAHIDRSCEIYHDGLKSYEKLHDRGYKHYVVNHSVEFSTADGVHTNTIEGLWGLLKQRVSRMHGLRSWERYAAHLDEFSFRQNYKINGSIWTKMVSLCAAK